MMMSLVLPLSAPEASLASVGGKGHALARLVAAGLPVPDGFFLTTDAYRAFIASNGLEAEIQSLAREAEAGNIEERAARIRALFEVPIPTDVFAAVSRAYRELRDEPAVAVRSSATAEDLPELSFAGQQDTILNVRGVRAVLSAVRRCWMSLWTARALAYRLRMGVDHGDVAMGVIVQRLIPAEASGILFTANPSTGARDELIVNASFGLGDAVVGGEVDPDTYVLARNDLAAKSVEIGGKAVMSVTTDAEGTELAPVPEAERRRAALSADLQAALGRLAVRAETLFDGTPQDVEWAVADGRCWLLQSRPITRLPPPPLEDVRWEAPAPGAKLIRRQVVENMPGPLTPLFEELYLGHGLERAVDAWLLELGAPLRIEDVIERPLFLTVNGFAYGRVDYRIGRELLRRIPRLLWWYVTSLRRLLTGIVPRWRDQGLPSYRATIDRWRSVDVAAADDAVLLAGLRELAVADARYWFDVSVVMGAAKVTDELLRRFLASRWVPGRLTSAVFLCGFPSRTADAQAALAHLALRIARSGLRDQALVTPADRLREVLGATPEGRSLCDDLDGYLETFGHQIYTLDFGEPTQVDDPLPVVSSLKTLVALDAQGGRPRQTVLAADRQRAVRETAAALGPVRRWLFRRLLAIAQRYAPHREEALFHLGAGWPTLRRLALELGRRRVAAGTLADPDDVFYLQTAELERTVDRPAPELREAASARRALREARKRLHPPGMIPETSRFTLGILDFSAWETQKRNAPDVSILEGFAVSPGRVTGAASVIRSPADFGAMAPGTILVCPTTTPAWTPLFAQATGLVTDIGGVLAHGSIVAREYGIPAVMGTGNGTQRIGDGQQIAVDGDAGTVTLK